MPPIVQQNPLGPTIAHSLRRDGITPVDGLYVHIPFCFHKCHYCDFYSVVDHHDRQEAFVARLERELEAASRWLEQPLNTVFFGGGTPTLLRVDLWKRLLDFLGRSVSLRQDVEWTVEANPETVTSDLAEVLASGGVNRISIGAQSFHPRHLKTLERWHDPANVGRAVALFRDAGIRNLNIDLINAIPGQRLGDVERDLERAVELQPTHLSCYSLTYEPGTPLTKRVELGEVTPTPESLEAEMYEFTLEFLESAGFEHYEVSNWSLPGYQCRHNMMYWTNGNWWACGPGASGHVNGCRWKNVPRVSSYLRGESGLPDVVDVERRSREQVVGEILMLGLRLRQGLRRADVDHLLTDDSLHRTGKIRRFLSDGMLEWHDDSLRLTRRGMLLADSVIAELI